MTAPTPSLRDVAQLLIESLEIARDAYEAWGNGTVKIDAAIASGRAALALPEAEPVAWIVWRAVMQQMDGGIGCGYRPDIRLTEPEASEIMLRDTVQPLYAAPQPAKPQAEIAGFIAESMDARWTAIHKQMDGKMLSGAGEAAPVERKPLTVEQIEDMRGEANRGFNIEREDYFRAVRDAEAAHNIQGAS